jgi:hypothetical protein
VAALGEVQFDAFQKQRLFSGKEVTGSSIMNLGGGLIDPPRSRRRLTIKEGTKPRHLGQVLTKQFTWNVAPVKYYCLLSAYLPLPSAIFGEVITVCSVPENARMRQPIVA